MSDGQEVDPSQAAGATPVETASEIEPEQVSQELDDLFNITVDAEALKDAETRMALPTGTYVTIPPMVTTRFRSEEGRDTIKLWGKVLGADESGKEIKGSASFSVGWEPRNGVLFKDGVNTGEDSGKPDAATKNYIQAKRAFKVAYGQEANNPGEVVHFLRDYAVRLRLANFDGVNRVLAISALKA